MPYTPPELHNLTFSEIAELTQRQKLPPVEQWKPQHSSDSKMRILSDGKWFHDGGEIKRTSMIRAFASLLRKDDDGYWLVTPYEKQSIIVEDVPFTAVELKCEGNGKERTIFMRTNVDDIIVIGPQNSISIQKQSHESLIPYINIRNGLMAKCTRSVAYELYDIGIEESEDSADGIGLWSNGCYFRLST